MVTVTGREGSRAAGQRTVQAGDELQQADPGDTQTQGQKGCRAGRSPNKASQGPQK